MRGVRGFGDGVSPRASVKLSSPNGTIEERVCLTAVGMIDAAVTAVNMIVGDGHPKLGSFFARSKAARHGEGSAAPGICDLTLHGYGNTKRGESTDPDVVIASVRAYLDGLNKLIEKEKDKEEGEPVAVEAAAR